MNRFYIKILKALLVQALLLISQTSDFFPQSTTESLYNELILTGDSLYRLRRCQEAHTVFQKAALVNPSGSKHEERIINSAGIIVSDSSEKAYIKSLLFKADSFYDHTDDYKTAHDYYWQVVHRNPLNTYACTRLFESDSMLIMYQLKLAKLADDIALTGKWSPADSIYHVSTMMCTTTNLHSFANYTSRMNSNMLGAKHWDYKNNDSLAFLFDSLGNIAILKQRYGEAKGNFFTSFLLGGKNEYVLKKISTCDSALREQIQDVLIYWKQKEYYTIGNELYNNREYIKAKAYFQRALATKPRFTNTEEMTRQCNWRIGQCDHALSYTGFRPGYIYSNENEIKYVSSVAEGDKASAGKNWNTAKQKYSEAISFKPSEMYPKQKIAEIDQLLKKEAEAAAAYAKTIKDADEKFNSKDWDIAKILYEKAAAIKPSEAYPKKQIALCLENKK